jgi:hypothetical protein
MLFLLGADSESCEIINLTNIKPEDQVGVNLGPMLEKADCDVTCSIRVDICVLHDAPLDLVLLMFD